MNEQAPEPLIELTLPSRERLRSRAARFVRQHRARVAGAVALVVGALVVAGHLLGGIAGLWEMYKLTVGGHGRAAESNSPAPLMSVAVLPFQTRGRETQTQQEPLAAQLTQEVTSALERAMRMALVASNGLASGHTPSADPRTTGRALNVRYLVHGEVRREGDEVAATVRLLETDRGAQIWSDDLLAAGEGSVADITGRLANRLRVAIYDAERRRLVKTRSPAESAAEAALRADALWDADPSPKGLAAARKLYEEALAIDPGSPSALIGLFRTSFGLYFQSMGTDRDRLIAEMDDLSLRAVRADRHDPRAWIARGNALGLQWKWDAAFDAMAEALRIDPYRNTALGYQGSLLILSGRAAEALPYLDRALAMDPRAAGRFLDNKCWAHQLLGQYPAAIAACERAITLEENWFNRLRLVALYALTGEMDKAQSMKAEVVKRRPNVSIESVLALRTSDNPVYLQQREEHLFAGLRKAGIPQRAGSAP